MGPYYYVFYDKIAIQITLPTIKKNEFGWGLFLKTLLLIGRKTFAISILGFGLAITGDRSDQNRWMWESWKRTDKKENNL